MAFVGRETDGELRSVFLFVRIVVYILVAECWSVAPCIYRTPPTDVTNVLVGCLYCVRYERGKGGGQASRAGVYCNGKMVAEENRRSQGEEAKRLYAGVACMALLQSVCCK